MSSEDWTSTLAANVAKRMVDVQSRTQRVVDRLSQSTRRPLNLQDLPASCRDLSVVFLREISESSKKQDAREFAMSLLKQVSSCDTIPKAYRILERSVRLYDGSIMHMYDQERHDAVENANYLLKEIRRLGVAL